MENLENLTQENPKENSFQKYKPYLGLTLSLAGFAGALWAGYELHQFNEEWNQGMGIIKALNPLNYLK